MNKQKKKSSSTESKRAADASRFSHLDRQGNVRMVDVTDKLPTFRLARAEGRIRLQPATLAALREETLPKGNVLTTAKVAGIQAAKRTAELIPLCHPLNLTHVDLEFELEETGVLIRSVVKTREATGVEMEALTAVAAAALTIYDMCKAVDPAMEISGIRLVEKRGGKGEHRTDYRPRVGVITLSDGVAAGRREDRSGALLQRGFREAGCPVEHYRVLPDGSDELVSTIREWITAGVELIITTGGTGIGPRDLTIGALEELFDRRLPGVEQALHAYGRGKLPTAMLSRLAVGVAGPALIVALPGSPGAARDALQVLIPTIFHAFHMLRGEGH
jgi:molybdenum cofactor biosynthesis protein MoaC